ncbi:sigma-70 family RNA polymerase sigma factor [Streptomyces sp. MI02-7b]|uniref:RNA polymerase sigma factor n=1 Tax=Streptomyces sp. MI02-7b TaxID=462941 RepID=UPI0029BA8CEA|nr:sigma-70 family RNA polymerase sigma factor [Streptomyces sp. MI02-7b]MDX3071138.1 sigma-70 family RNA polymerase sigma factor [Streptomyces sp. MI02-7b]
MQRRRTTTGGPAGHQVVEALYTAHADRVLGYLLHRTDRDTAQDILSETFVLAWHKSDSVPDDALPWLLASARRLLANRVRSDQRYRAATARMATFADRPGTIEIGDAIGTRSEVFAALLALSEPDREALLLSAWYDLTARQAAVVMGCTATAFAVRLHRARKRFKAALTDADQTPAVPGTHRHPHFAQRESA